MLNTDAFCLNTSIGWLGGKLMGVLDGLPVLAIFQS